MQEMFHFPGNLPLMIIIFTFFQKAVELHVKQHLQEVFPTYHGVAHQTLQTF